MLVINAGFVSELGITNKIQPTKAENVLKIFCLPKLFQYFSIFKLSRKLVKRPNDIWIVVKRSIGMAVPRNQFTSSLPRRLKQKCRNCNSWFSADVISLCKVRFRHVGAHARCEIVSKSMAFLRAHYQSFQIIHLSNGYFPRKGPKITR